MTSAFDLLHVGVSELFSRRATSCEHGIHAFALGGVSSADTFALAFLFSLKTTNIYSGLATADYTALA
jgi:hypothetical protein